MTKINKNEVKELFEQGKTKKEIADSLGVGKSTISMALKEFGLTKNLEEIKVNEEELRKLHSEGKTAIEIMKLMKISKSASFNTHNKLGLIPNVLTEEKRAEISESTRKFNPTKDELIELKKNNTYQKIADMFQVSTVAVYKRMKKFGII